MPNKIRLTKADWDAIGTNPYLGEYYKTPRGRASPATIVVERRGLKVSKGCCALIDETAAVIEAINWAGKALAKALGYDDETYFWEGQCSPAGRAEIRRRLKARAYADGSITVTGGTR